MEKQKTFTGIKFPISTIEEAFKKFSALVGEDWKKKPHVTTFQITIGDEKVDYDSFEEFLNSYLKAERYYLALTLYSPYRSFAFYGSRIDVDVKVQLPTSQDIDSIMYVFERDKGKSVLPAKTSTREPILTIVREKIAAKKIFIGHGHNEQWRLLKDHLFHQHKYDVIFYEEAPRAGLVTQSVLESMLNESDIALIVCTGEDSHSDGTIHARENVIHELGLFQGYLGFDRAIMLLEEGVSELSNMHGINQIRFPKGKLQEKYGDIVAVIKKLRT